MSTAPILNGSVARGQTKKEKAQAKLQERKNFLRAVLAQEMQSRLATEEQLHEVEQELGLIGTHHGEDYERFNGAGSLSGKKGGGTTLYTRDTNHIPSINEQYTEVLDEVQFVAGQPVGSKESIIRLHYLLEEEERVKNLRVAEKMGTFVSSN
ncbi:hypothetical protein STCU_11657 [Strigomonas culicis]|uniref:Uncharacterized protein n=1 Tax=Strigomonas culicis TaxID=28005 RepID=S9UZG1_9TRYP|nr:hypothetical protein STCU_11657 [Strigomonas culicis]|eukprot:EPY15945.1 hypothetical protein STCU_11657 [Strigomonas culicis]